MNQAKAELIGFGMTEEETKLKAIVANWPVEVITNQEIAGVMGEELRQGAAARHVMDRAGLRKLPLKVRVYEQGPQHLYATKRFNHWAAQRPDALRAEIIRVKDKEKQGSIDREDAPGQAWHLGTGTGFSQPSQ